MEACFILRPSLKKENSGYHECRLRNGSCLWNVTSSCVIREEGQEIVNHGYRRNYREHVVDLGKKVQATSLFFRERRVKACRWKLVGQGEIVAAVEVRKDKKNCSA